MPSVVAVTEFQIDGDAVLSMAESRSCIVEDHCDTRFLARGESVVLIHGDKRINGIVDVRQRVAPGRALYAVRMASN